MTLYDEVRAWLADAAVYAADVTSDPRIADGARFFQGRIASAAECRFDARPQPVTATAAGVDDTELARRFAGFADELPWSRSPRWDDGGHERALCVFSEMFELNDVVAGLVYLDAGGTYPEHSHPPQELYLTISGAAEWRFGGAEEFVQMPAGATLYNHPHDRHAIRAGSAPVVAMYVLWGADVSFER